MQAGKQVRHSVQKPSYAVKLSEVLHDGTAGSALEQFNCNVARVPMNVCALAAGEWHYQAPMEQLGIMMVSCCWVLGIEADRQVCDYMSLQRCHDSAGPWSETACLPVTHCWRKVVAAGPQRISHWLTDLTPWQLAMTRVTLQGLPGVVMVDSVFSEAGPDRLPKC